MLYEDLAVSCTGHLDGRECVYTTALTDGLTDGPHVERLRLMIVAVAVRLSDMHSNPYRVQVIRDPYLRWSETGRYRKPEVRVVFELLITAPAPP